MNWSPIIERELRVRAGQAGFRWLRVALAGFAILACLQWFNFNTTSMWSANLGQQSFAMLARIAFVLALGACILTADCVSSERREGTLGLLFLTTLKSQDVALGKFVASGLTALYALLGFVPMLLLPLLTGGVTGGEVLRVALALLNLMFISLAVGLCVSVFARSQFNAILSAFAFLAALCLAPPFVEMITRSTLEGSFSLLSPVTACFAAPEAAFANNPAPFWWSLPMSHALGWAILSATAFALGRNWREIYAPRAARVPPPQVHGLIGAPRAVLDKAALRRRVFAPVARAVLRMPGQEGLAWLGACLSVTGSLAATFALRGLGSVWAAASVTAIFSFSCAALFAFVAGRFLFEARRNGELELLLVTPVGARGILREQRFALVRLLRGPFYFAVVGAIPVAVVGATMLELVGLAQGLSYIGSVASGILAACWMGSWFATGAKHHFSVIGWTVGVVELLPTAVVYVLPLLMLGGWRGLFEAWIVALPTIFVVKNLVFIAYARERLRREYRVNDGIRFNLTANWRGVGTPPGTAEHSQPST